MLAMLPSCQHSSRPTGSVRVRAGKPSPLTPNRSTRIWLPPSPCCSKIPRLRPAGSARSASRTVAISPLGWPQPARSRRASHLRGAVGGGDRHPDETLHRDLHQNQRADVAILHGTADQTVPAGPPSTSAGSSPTPAAPMRSSSTMAPATASTATAWSPAIAAQPTMPGSAPRPSLPGISGGTTEQQSPGLLYVAGTATLSSAATLHRLVHTSTCSGTPWASRSARLRASGSPGASTSPPGFRGRRGLHVGHVVHASAAHEVLRAEMHRVEVDRQHAVADPRRRGSGRRCRRRSARPPGFRT